MAQTYPICNADGEEIDAVCDINPIVIESEEACITKLEELLTIADLTAEETDLVNVCLQSIKAQEGEEVQYGPEHQAQFFDFIMAHSDYGNEIAACAEYLNHVIDQILDPSTLDGEFIDNLFAGDFALSEMLVQASTREEPTEVSS